MKKLLIFIAGMVSGILLLFLISLFVANQSSNDGLRLFEEEGECVSTNSFQVIQVLDSGSALAREIEKDYFYRYRHNRFILERRKQFLL